MTASQAGPVVRINARIAPRSPTSSKPMRARRRTTKPHTALAALAALAATVAAVATGCAGEAGDGGNRTAGPPPGAATPFTIPAAWRAVGSVPGEDTQHVYRAGCATVLVDDRSVGDAGGASLGRLAPVLLAAAVGTPGVLRRTWPNAAIAVDARAGAAAIVRRRRGEIRAATVLQSVRGCPPAAAAAVHARLAPLAVRWATGASPDAGPPV